MIWKIEEEPIILKSGVLPEKRRLKICTLKVDYTGYRLGERFIKMSIDYAIKNNIDELIDEGNSNKWSIIAKANGWIQE